MLKGHPKGLLVLAITNMGERFGYYTMLAILALYMQAKFGLTSGTTSLIYGSFLAMVYFLPILGGFVADKALGYGKTILLGISVMFCGYFLLAIPSENNSFGMAMMFAALFLISLGTGFFKGNLQALVGKIYDAPAFKANRDIAFSIFYMFINIGAFFAPSVADSINIAVLKSDNFTYDANIPKNFVTLNDQVVNKDTFVMEHLSSSDLAMPEKELQHMIKQAKKKAHVIFESDREQALFNLKAAGIYQLSQSGRITDPAITLSKEDYQILESRDPQDATVKAAVIDKINAIQITDPTMFGGENPDDFSKKFGEEYVTKSLSASYNWAFGVACISLIISVLIFMLFRKTWKGSDKTLKQELKESAKTGVQVKVLSKQQVRERLIALFLVFFVVIFFWMSFHQNGLCMTFFARDYTISNISSIWTMAFKMLALIPLIVFLYGIYLSTIGLLGGKANRKLGILLILVGLASLVAYYLVQVQGVTETTKITPQIFQQFNPMFIIILTPLTVGLFAYLSRRGKEPSAPRKIGIGMIIAAIGFLVLMIGSLGLPAPSEISGISESLVSPSWLIGTYFILTIAELFLSPMGLSFVAKVAPPQYSGMMQGGWLAATAIGNYLVGVMGTFWEKLPLYMFWTVLVICCILSAMFIFSVMKRLERVTSQS